MLPSVSPTPDGRPTETSEVRPARLPIRRAATPITQLAESPYIFGPMTNGTWKTSAMPSRR